MRAISPQNEAYRNAICMILLSSSHRKGYAVNKDEARPGSYSR